MKINKLLMILCMLGFIVWAGVSFSQRIIAYDIFLPFDPELHFKADYDGGILFHNVYLYTSLSVYANIAYIVFFVTGLLIVISQRQFLREKGWLAMTSLLVLVAMPYQVYNVISTIQLSLAIFHDGLRDFNSYVIQENFLDFFKNIRLQIWGTLALLSNFTAVIIAICKPLNGYPPKMELKHDENA